jgi:mannose-6-phosphate isomerase-like protein (cupin superfamily)
MTEPLEKCVGRHMNKIWDWDAFPASRGYPELSRAQMRYIGSGGSPKTGDESTLIPQHFTTSLLYQEPRKYAAVHSHEIEEIFVIHSGRMVVSWDFDGTFIDIPLGPGDALLNPADRAHGFRNDGPEPVLAQFMVGHPKPMLPKYQSHPSEGGNAPEFDQPIPNPDDERVRETHKYLVRASQVRPVWHDLGHGSKLASQPYVMPAGHGAPVESIRFSLELVHLPSGAASPVYEFADEVAFMVWNGLLTVEFAATDTESTHLGPRDLVRVPAGQPFRISNDGAAVATASAAWGTPAPAAGRWTAATD